MEPQRRLVIRVIVAAIIDRIVKARLDDMLRGRIGRVALAHEHAGNHRECIFADALHLRKKQQRIFHARLRSSDQCREPAPSFVALEFIRDKLR